ncbi:hypothetical protein B0H21DRAFT_453728 [Amylocystis lapponica]|nr:hypothetical protein B0H21DRAFT_453728 [Amylocystis lapponica]
MRDLRSRGVLPESNAGMLSIEGKKSTNEMVVVAQAAKVVRMRCDPQAAALDRLLLVLVLGAGVAITGYHLTCPTHSKLCLGFRSSLSVGPVLTRNLTSYRHWSGSRCHAEPYSMCMLVFDTNKNEWWTLRGDRSCSTVVLQALIAFSLSQTEPSTGMNKTIAIQEALSLQVYRHDDRTPCARSTTVHCVQTPRFDAPA